MPASVMMVSPHSDCCDYFWHGIAGVVVSSHETDDIFLPGGKESQQSLSQSKRDWSQGYRQRSVQTDWKEDGV